MNAKPLFTEDRKDIVAYYCSECRIVRKTEAEANKCCAPNLCGCGVALEHKWNTQCWPCQQAEALQKLKARLRKADVVNEPTCEMIYTDAVTTNEGYVSLEELAEAIELDDDLSMPLFVYDCDKQYWKGLDASDLIENALDGDWPEGSDAHIVDEDELNAFLKQWNAKQDLCCYDANMDRIIILDKEGFEAWLSE